MYFNSPQMTPTLRNLEQHLSGFAFELSTNHWKELEYEGSELLKQKL